MQSLLKYNRKGNVNAKMTALFGALILIVVAGGLAPTMFGAFNSTASQGGAPGWVFPTILVVIAGGFIMIIWRSIVTH